MEEMGFSCSGSRASSFSRLHTSPEPPTFEGSPFLCSQRWSFKTRLSPSASLRCKRRPLIPTAFWLLCRTRTKHQDCESVRSKLRGRSRVLLVCEPPHRSRFRSVVACKPVTELSLQLWLRLALAPPVSELELLRRNCQCHLLRQGRCVTL